MKVAALALALALAASAAPAGPLINPLFQDHAVLQRDRPIALWGEAAPGAKVQLELDGAQGETVAGPDGRWQATLPARPAGGPFNLRVRSGNEAQSLSDVLVGDVWLCSGQSNMEYPLERVTNGPSLVDAATDERMRLLKIARRSRTTAQTTIEAGDRWQATTPQTARAFSAACYFMGRDLRRTQGVPVGLIDATWGGSMIQAWMSRERLAGLGRYEEGLSILADYQRDPRIAQTRWSAAVARWADRTQPETKAWARPDFDDRAWPTFTPSTFWEDAGVPALANFDGVVWHRTEVTLTKAQARQGARLLLGPIDDLDSTFVNGQFVGSTPGWDTPRDYAVPVGILRPGRNVIAVRAVDTGGGGGLWGPPEARRLRLADGSDVPIGPAWRFRVARPLAEIGPPPQTPWSPTSGLSTLYSGMIAPLGPYGLKGVAWYQGEANVTEPDEYARLLPALIADWRARFRVADLPFLVVQLAPFGPPSPAPQDTTLSRLRDAQRRAVQADPRAGLAVTIDIGDPGDIHPTNKQDVGRRLALLARRIAYGEAVAASAPEPVSARRDGERVVVAFSPGGLVTYGAARPVGFELCDSARRCRYVDATVVGDKVLLEAGSGEVSFVRYAWADSPVVNLFDGGKLPVGPYEMPVR